MIVVDSHVSRRAKQLFHFRQIADDLGLVQALGPHGLMVVKGVRHCYRPPDADTPSSAAGSIVLCTLPEYLVVLLPVAVVHVIVLY